MLVIDILEVGPKDHWRLSFASLSNSDVGGRLKHDSFLWEATVALNAALREGWEARKGEPSLMNER